MIILVTVEYFKFLRLQYPLNYIKHTKIVWWEIDILRANIQVHAEIRTSDAHKNICGIKINLFFKSL